MGKLTIGVGRNLTDRGITREESRFMLDNDLHEVTAGLDAAIPWWRSLDPVRALVVADMRFNLGHARFMKFAPTMEVIRRGEYERAARRLERTLWYRQVGRRSRRLVAMMRTGEQPL